MRICAVVLAGGAGRRMGGADKPLLAFRGEALIARILRTIGPQVTAAAISANGDPARYAGFGLPVLADRAFAGAGPLAGVLAGLAWADGAGAEALLSVPGDVPFLPGDLVARLLPGPSWAEGGGRVHPLIALWPVAAEERLRAHLVAGGSRAVRVFGEALGMRVVAFAGESFANLNTPGEWAAAEAGGRV